MFNFLSFSLSIQNFIKYIFQAETLSLVIDILFSNGVKKILM